MRKSIHMMAAIFLILGLSVAGCGGAGQEEAEQAAPVLTEIMPGLSYVDSVVGQGALVQADDFVVVHYAGYVYENGVKGDKFDASYDREEPIAFPLGRGFVITGWEKGVPGMHVGGKRSLIIAADHAYGEQGRPPVIPPSATLFFDIEVMELPIVTTEIQSEGTGPVAAIGDQISVHYTGWVWENNERGEEFDSSHNRGVPYKFTLGAGMVIPGWDFGLEGLKVGTKARLIIPPVMAYGKRGSPPKIPADATLCFDVELVEIAGK